MTKDDESLAAFGLPSNLTQRTRLITTRPTPVPSADVRSSGQFVLYWMRTAMRATENPALDVALAAASALDLPLLVYQGLSERYPFASDRHHLFVLQGARDVALQLQRRGLPYVFHLERPGSRGPHLRTLADQAALVITEEMPVDPLRRWTALLSQQTTTPVYAVDTACLVPMKLVGRAYERAFEYRRATQREADQRLRQAWVELEVPLRCHSWQLPPLPFQPLDLTNVDLTNVDFAELVATCDIDHSIGPVADTVGGSLAGYARWDAFRRDNLGGYARRRNDALQNGASRMSAYLHYGMVSPFLLARQCAEAGGAGAEKYLDELLIWRELAYSFCYYRSDHPGYRAIPRWARQTLEQHADDHRPAIHAWETLARGETGEPLWDAAQKSLLIHGELHNNVRMTWGKAILNWRPNAADALKTVIDLNHRYALDGRDPASYGGILWCFGQFDRPFPPAQPILGTVRGRSVAAHADRLDPAAYRARTMRPLYRSMPRIAMIGGGISGLACARTLADHGLPVTVFEKSRGLGGRMATRRTDAGSFDHGAQYFTCRDPLFRRYVDSWIEDQIVGRWNGRVKILERGELRDERAATQRFVGVPGMSSLCKHLGRDLPIHLSTRIAGLDRVSGGWTLLSDDRREFGPFEIVLISTPAPQAAGLLEPCAALRDACRAVTMNPCWAVMAAFNQSLELSYDGAFVHDAPLAWVMRDSSKPSRDTTRDTAPETWVLHASSRWSEAHLEESPQVVEQLLLDAFWQSNQIPPHPPRTLLTHRWRFAIPADPLPERSLWDRASQLGVCGDWCGGPRVEGAFLSGISLAGRALRELHQTRMPAFEENERQKQLF
jgi:photolyase PhrII